MGRGSLLLLGRVYQHESLSESSCGGPLVYCTVMYLVNGRNRVKKCIVLTDAIGFLFSSFKKMEMDASTILYECIGF